MRSILKVSGFLLLASLVFTACGTSKVYNVPPQKVHTQKSSESTYRAIRSAGQSLGWKIRKIKSGVAEGKLSLRTHVAVVRINYTRNSYSIRYVRSTNLKYNASKGTIHSNYNGWIQNLEKAIVARL